MATSEANPAEINLPPTSWTVLALLSYEEEVSGYDLKKWADWTIRYFYWSPSHSQIYSELKKLERDGFAESRVDGENRLRGRRLYRITPRGRDAVTAWSGRTPVDRPMLKHHVMLRVMFGHLSSPTRLKEILRDHIADVRQIEYDAATEAHAAEFRSGWEYAHLVLAWAERYYAAESSHTQQLIEDIDAAEATLARDGQSASRNPVPGHWREVEQRVRKADAGGNSDRSMTP